MSTFTLCKAIKHCFIALMAIGLLSVGSTPSAAGNKRNSAPAKTPSRPASRPSGSSHGFGGGARGNSGRGSGLSGRPGGSSGYRGPSANGGGYRGPSANGRGMSGPSANSREMGGMRGGGMSANRSNFRASAPRGSNERMARNGSMVRTRANGRISDVHDARRGMDIHRGLNGNRRVMIERHDGSRMVFARGRPGFVGHPYSFRGHAFERRAYFYHGHAYERFYRGYGYHGVMLDVYAPTFYFGVGFYGWAYNPWAVPVAYGWGWAGDPWYGYYGYYFQPYPVYPSAAFWLTDYMISQDLQADYAAHQEAGETDGTPAAAGSPPELTPQVKQQIADEVRDQLALENQEAAETAQGQSVDPGSSGIARMMADGRSHVFVAGDALDLVDSTGNECGISDGDVLMLQTPPPADASAADLIVMASKGGDECAKSSTVTVQLTDLQAMQNQMRTTIDQGLQELQTKQGTDGLPQAPPSAQVKPTEAAYASDAPPPSAQDAADLQQQSQQADQAEQDAAAQ